MARGMRAPRGDRRRSAVPAVSAAAALAAGALVAGCGITPDRLLPMLAGEDPARASGARTAAAPDDEARRPLVVIRFVTDDIRFSAALRREISSALGRDPGLRLDLVAVAPPGEGGLSRAARRGEAVLRALADAGLPHERVRVSAMTSSVVAVSEVHLYAR